MANIPELSVIDIMNVESQFITVFMYENLQLDRQSLCERMIGHSFHDKLQYLADRPDVLQAAKSYFANERKKPFTLNMPK